MTELKQRPTGRKRKYAEYEELWASIKGTVTGRPAYRNGIGISSGIRGATAWLKVHLSHGAVYRGRSYKAKSYLEIKAGRLDSFTWEQLEDLFRLYQGKADRGEPLEEAQVLTFSEFAEGYLARVNMVPAGARNTNLSIESALQPAFGGKSLKDITAQDIDLWQSSRLKDVKSSTVQRQKNILRAVLNMAVSDGLIDRNPCDRSRSIKIEERKPRVMTRGEIDIFLQTACEINGWLTDFILWGLHSGMRRGEILALEWANIIQKPNGAYFVEFRSGKTRKIRIIPCTSATWGILERQRKRVNEAEKRIFSYPLITLTRAWATLRDKTGIKDIRIHDLRVAFGSYGASAGVPLKTLASMMGHSTLRMLEKHYVGVSESDRVLASNTIQKSFEPTPIAGEKNHDS